MEVRRTLNEKDINRISVLCFLGAIYFGICLVKLLIVPHIKAPVIVFDESRYFSIAYQIWHNHTFIEQLPFSQYPPLYPLILSPVSVLDTVYDQYYCSLIINVFLSTSVIFPVFFLAYEYLNSNKYSLAVSGLIGIAPPFFLYTFTLMAENLYFVLFASSVLFMKRVWNKNNFSNNLVAGILISLTVLTKLIGLCLVVVYIGEKIWQKIEKYRCSI